MSRLLAISVGPVQESIAEARRTRALWFGSYLLSEISKAVAQSVAENGRTLIFPSPSSDSKLDADSSLGTASRERNLSGYLRRSRKALIVSGWLKRYAKAAGEDG